MTTITTATAAPAISLNAHKAFFTQTTALAKELAAIEGQVQTQEQQLLSSIQQLSTSVREAAKAPQPETVRQALQNYFEQTEQVLGAWEHKVSSYDAGLSFRKQFGDSLLVFVFGKVKAGKSALGNFVATGRSKPDAAWMQQLARDLHQPQYFTTETNTSFGERIDHQQGFQVGETETTSCIQGFTLPGLTWVDSPGLHSVNSANGELAQKYVDSADLIIYPMNSAQPGRGSDLSEIEGLLKSGKRFLVLITRCDSVEEDEDKDGNIISQLMMKSAKDRQDQEQYVQQEIDALCQKLGVQDVQITVQTVSVGYAEAHGNTAQALQESGMQALFEQLQSLLSSQGIALKKQAPRDNLHAFCRMLLADEGELSLRRLLAPLDGAMQHLQQLQAQLDSLQALALPRIEHDFAQSVDTLIETHAESRNLHAVERELHTVIGQTVTQHYQQPLQALYAEALGSMQQLSHNMGLCMGLSFADKTAEITVDVSQKSAAVGGGFGAIALAIAGFFIAGPAGAAVGATAGSIGGSLAGASLNPKERRTIRVGDNREELKARLLEQGMGKLQEHIASLNAQAQIEVLQPMRQALAQLQSQAQQFEQSTQQQLQA